MNVKRLSRDLPAFALLFICGLAVAQTVDQSGRDVPYSGYLEENGLAVTGIRDVQITLFNADDAADECDEQLFEDVDVVGGRFQVTLEDLPNLCLFTGELFVTISVGEPDGALTELGTGTGSGRVPVQAVPFASAVPVNTSMLVGTGQIVVNDAESGHDVFLKGSDSLYPDQGIGMRIQGTLNSGDSIFRVMSVGGSERLRVEHDGETSTTNDLRVDGFSYLDGNMETGTATITTANTTTTNATTVNGDTVNTDFVQFASQTGPKLNLFSSTYGLGVENSTLVLHANTGANFAFGTGVPNDTFTSAATISSAGAITGTSVTTEQTDINGANGCVQFGAAQMCWHRRGTTGNDNARTVTWRRAFSGTNYRVTCTAESTAQHMVMLNSVSSTAATVRVANENGNYIDVAVQCMAMGNGGAW